MSKTNNHEESYLSRLTFNEQLKNGWVWKFIGNIRIVLLLVISILALGIFGYINLPKRLNPEIKIPIVTVSTALPGASPKDVESLVSIPLENALGSVEGVDTTTSISISNISILSIQFFSNIDREKAKNDVQSAVDTVTNLPSDAKDPQVKLIDFEDQPVWTFALSSKGGTASLMRFSDELKRKLEEVPQIDRVTLSGFDAQEIRVSVNTAKVKDFNVSPFTLSTAIRNALNSYPAGTIQTESNSFSLTIDPSIASVNDLRELSILVNGTPIKLGDIADISEGSKVNQAYSFLANKDTTGKRVVVVNVFKTLNANIDEAGTKATNVVNQELDAHPNEYTVTTVINTATEITKQQMDLLGEFRSTILLVVACLILFLGLRQAIIAIFTIPLTFLASFFLMDQLGMSINFLSLFALLIALGLLIDDTIVVVSAMTGYFKTGKFTPKETGVLVWRDTIVPIWSTTITTIWSFVPLLLASGIIGEFIKPIPIVVTVTMLSSTAIAVLVTLPFMVILLKPDIPKRVVALTWVLILGAILGVFVYIFRQSQDVVIIAALFILISLLVYRIKKYHSGKIVEWVQRRPRLNGLFNRINYYSTHGIIDITPFSNWYHDFIKKILLKKSSRRIVIISIVLYSVWAFALLPLGLVKNEFFPKTDENLISVNLELPSGTSLTENANESIQILNDIRKIPEVEFVTLEVGKALDSFGASSDSGNTSLFTVHLVDKDERERSSSDVSGEVRKMYESYTKGKISANEASNGPPAGSDLQIKLSGDDLGKLDTYANQISDFLKKQAGITNINKSIKPGTSKIVFVPDNDALLKNNISIDQIGLWMRTYVSGFTLTDANFEEQTSERKDIVFTFDGGIKNPDTLTTLSIPTQTGSVPLSVLGTFKIESNPTVITREDGKRTLSVSAAVEKGYVVTDKNKDLETFAKGMNLPSGYTWSTGGANEENQKSVQSIIQAMVVAFILILITMVIQFNSFRQAIIVLMVIPLAVSSVFAVFALTGTPLSFPALIGVLSLFGIVVTNSMFIVDKINLNIREGLPFIEAVSDAGASRMEPIILTKLCTIFGLLPITLADPLWRGLGGAVISGLLIASVIMLLFIPVVYYSWFAPKEETELADDL
jgi:multidrug efflux pump subunit AcrB